MLTIVLVTAVARSFKLSVIEWVIEDPIDTAQRKGFVAPSFEVEVVLEPVVNLPSTPLLVSEFLKYLFNDWRANGIDNDLALLVHQPLVEIAERSHARPQPHLDPCS